MFKCKVCLEKDKRITELQEQVTYLREMTNPGRLTVTLPRVHEEANRVLSNVDMPVPTEMDLSIEEEATRILTGNF